MQGNPASWFEIYVHDMERARAFYEHVFEVRLSPLPSQELELLAFPQSLTSYGAGGALARMPGCEPGGTGTLVYFSCDDCAVQAKRAQDAGGRIMKPRQSIGPSGFIALVFDSEGNLIGLHSMK